MSLEGSDGQRGSVWLALKTGGGSGPGNVGGL